MEMTIDRALEIFSKEAVVISCRNLEDWKKARDLLVDTARKYQMMQAECNEQFKNGMWILTSEKLPEDGTWNVFTDGKTISVERFKLDAMDHFYPDGRWFEFEDVVAWMPLPKPYEPQESEE